MCSKENENMRNYLEKSGLASMGASVMALSMPSNDCLASGVHLISWSFPSMLVIYFTILSNSAMNILRKFNFPRNDWTSTLFHGSSILLISSTLFGSILMPSYEIIFPNNFPSFIEKNDFLGFREIQNFCISWTFSTGGWHVLHQAWRKQWYCPDRWP